MNEEDSERDRATQEEEEEEGLFKADAVNEEDPSTGEGGGGFIDCL